MRDIRVATVQFQHQPGDAMVVADLDASLLPTSSGRRWLRARRPELYESLARPTGQEQDIRAVRFGEPRR